MVQIDAGAAGVGTFSYPIRVHSADRSRSEELHPLVDTGSLFTWLPAAVLQRLGASPERQVPFKMANGQFLTRPVGEVGIEIDGQTQTSIVVFAGPDDMTLLGAHTLEAFLLMPDVVHQRLVPIVGTVATGVPGPSA